MKNGGLNHSTQGVINTLDSQRGLEAKKSQSILETNQELEDLSLAEFLVENPEVSFSSFITHLELMGVSGWWFTTTNITAENGTNLLKVLIAPPENYNLLVEEKNGEKNFKVVPLKLKDKK